MEHEGAIRRAHSCATDPRDAVREFHAGVVRPELGCDCILRRLEIIQRQMVSRVEDLMRKNQVVGFSSYGEQYRGVHVNQTLTGLAIGRRTRRVQGV